MTPRHCASLNYVTVKMLLAVALVCALTSCVTADIGPLIFAAPSAVSHQSRVDIKHSAVNTSPLIYSPGTFYARHPARAVVASETILTPVITDDTVLTPIAFGFFHNLPLARALKHPVSIENAQAEATAKDLMTKNEETLKQMDESVNNKYSTSSVI